MEGNQEIYREIDLNRFTGAASCPVKRLDLYSVILTSGNEPEGSCGVPLFQKINHSSRDGETETLKVWIWL